jgi:hypothetical protein
MSASLTTAPLEHLNPHDLVTYSRCPYEMELLRSRRASLHSGTAVGARTPLDVVPLRHSPLFSPPLVHSTVNEGRLDIGMNDTLVYVDEGERDLPVLFPPERVRLDPQFARHGPTLMDDELGLAGRPDMIVRTENGRVYPIEYKATHLFVGYHEAHGRLFDTIQVIAECRLIEAVTGVAPEKGVVLYGDLAGDGQREGFVEIAYGASEAGWLRAALRQVRADAIRPPVPSEGTCGNCEANRDKICRFAATAYHDSRPR